MNKNKAATAKQQSRQRTDWSLFFRLCKQGKTNAEIAKKLGWKVDSKSEDPFKRVRAAKSLARTRGIKVDGKLTFLKDAKLKGAEKPKTTKTKKTKPKVAVSQPSPSMPADNKQNE